MSRRRRRIVVTEYDAMLAIGAALVLAMIAAITLLVIGV